jgi:dipeptidase D
MLFRLEVSGLRGGHSGIDIHIGRGNAIKLLAEALRGWAGQGDLKLVELKGGSARNAIPREAHAVMAVAESEVSGLKAWVDECRADWNARFAGVDEGVKLSLQAIDEACPSFIDQNDQDRLLAFLDTAANGVASTSAEFLGVTDTSGNLGVVALENGALRATFKVRSLENGRADALADKLVAHARNYGFSARKDGAYPGWTPNPASPLLALCQRVYTAEFGQSAGLQVIHAGLECGLLAASHPHLDMISFGPDIRGAHAPGERVEIASVAQCWTLLKALLRALSGVDAGLTLYGTCCCHLCDDAVVVLQTAGVSALWVDVADDDALTERYGVRIPVLRRADGAEMGWPFDAEAVRRFSAG